MASFWERVKPDGKVRLQGLRGIESLTVHSPRRTRKTNTRGGENPLSNDMEDY